MPKKKPANANVPTSWKGQDKLFGERIKENVDVLTGVRGDPMDRAITARDLVDSGIAKIPQGNTTFTGSSSGLEPVATGTTTNENLDPIPAPTNLQAAGAFQRILLTWDLSQYTGHAFVQVFRHSSDDVANATMIAQVSGYTGIYSDPVGGDADFYYWVKAVNTNGEVGPFNSSSGTQGTTDTDVSVLLTTLSNAITSSELASELSTPIGEISGIQADITEIETAITNLKNTPAWVVTTDYVVGDLVSYSNNLYSALTAHTSTAGNAPDTTPQDSTEWQHIGAYGSIVDVLAQTESTRATLISDYITTADSNTAIAGAKTELRSAFYNDALGLSNWDANTPYTYSASTNVRVVYEDKVYTLLQNSTGNQPDTSSAYWAEDPVQSESSVGFNHYTKSSTDSAIAASKTELRSAFYNDALGLNNWDSATSYTYSANTNVRVVYEDKVYVLLQNSTNNQPDTATAYWAEDPVQSESVIEQNHYTKTDADSAISTAVATATSGLTNPDGSNSTVTLSQAMTTQADVNDGLKGQYTVKINTDGNVAGFGLASTSTAAGANTSEFFVQADRFAIMPEPAPATTANQTELVTNGTFTGSSPYSGDVSSFTAAEGTIVAYYTSARIVDDGGPDVYCYQAINTTIGEQYRLQAQFYYSTGAGTLAVSNTTNVSDVFASSPPVSQYQSGTHNRHIDFTATATTTYVMVRMTLGSNYQYVAFDNVSCKRLYAAPPSMWSVSTTYYSGTHVVFNGFGSTPDTIYRARITHYSSSTTTAPPNATYWDTVSAVPFAVQTTSQVVNGVTIPAGVYMDAAHIKNGSITTAQIQNANVDMLNVTGNLSANRIQGGTIDTSLLNIDGSTITTDANTGALQIGTLSVDTADIVNGAITNAKIDGAIQSTDFVAQDTTTNPVTAGVGWRIDKAGGAEFTNATFRGNLDAATGTLGVIDVSEDGHIKSGQSAFDTGTGFFLGNDGGTTKFSVGTANGARLTWNGSSLVIKNAEQVFSAGSNPLVVSTSNTPFVNNNAWTIAKSITCSFSGTVKAIAIATRYYNVSGTVQFGIGKYVGFGGPASGYMSLTTNGQQGTVTASSISVSAGDVIHCYVNHTGNIMGHAGIVESFGLYIAEIPPNAATVTYDAGA